MEKNYAAIQAEGAEVIALSSDTPAQAKEAIERGVRRFGVKVRFPVLSDAETQAIAAYNMTDPFNKRLARPITYIIDENGIIRWKFLDVRVGLRIPTTTIINELKKL